MFDHQPNHELSQKAGKMQLQYTRPRAKQAAQLGASSSFAEVNQEKQGFFSFAHAGFSKLILAPSSKAISAECSQIHRFYVFVCSYSYTSSFSCFMEVGCASTLAMKQKQEEFLSPDSEFVQACTTALLPCEAPKGIF